MKKDLFIILSTILIVLILIYLYDQKESIVNKELISINPNIHIEYPYFHNTSIDTYIKSYLTNYNNENNVFIDYDYKKENSNIKLILYIYQKENHMIKKEEKWLNINLVKENIETTKKENYYNHINNTQGKISKKKKMIALTFNDGPNHNTIKVLEILKKYNIKATFFISKYNIKGNEKIIQKINNSNMEIETYLSKRELSKKNRREEQTTDQLIYNITKNRPTFARIENNTLNYQQLNKPIIMWSLDSLDKINHSSYNISQRIINKISDGDIILMHDIYNATVNSLNILIPELLKKEYQFVTIKDLLKHKNIPIEKRHTYYNCHWKLKTLWKNIVAKWQIIWYT